MKETILVILISTFSYSLGLVLQQISIYLDFKNQSKSLQNLFLYLSVPFYYVLGFAGLLLFGFGRELDSKRLYSIHSSNIKKAYQLAKLELSGDYLQRLRFASDEGDKAASAILPILTEKLNEVSSRIYSLCSLCPKRNRASILAKNYSDSTELPPGYDKSIIKEIHDLYEKKESYLTYGLDYSDYPIAFDHDLICFDFDTFVSDERHKLGLTE